jgi:tRNA threonylcarbamoyladenosine biosynthesis protein TsaB
LISLAIDASTYVGTLAVIHDQSVVARGEATMRGREAEALMPAVADTLRRAGVRTHDLSRIVCGAGPGSFTSLRIAASIAKGIAVGTGCPLFAVSSLALLAVGGDRPPTGSYLAVLDALRGEAYVGGYRIMDDGDVTMILAEQLVRHEEVAAAAAAIGAMTVGAGQGIERAPHAVAAAALGRLLVDAGPVELGAWEPRYGRKAEAQMRWEASNRRPLPFGGSA